MTGQDVQDKLNGIVVDLQTYGKGQTVNIMFRNADNSPNVLPLSSDASGTVSAAQLAAVQAVVDNLKTQLDAYDTAYQPLKNAGLAFRAARLPHAALIQAASLAGNNLKIALDADPAYQSAKAAVDAASRDAAYITAREAYRANNVSENISELANAKGAYVA